MSPITPPDPGLDLIYSYSIIEYIIVYILNAREEVGFVIGYTLTSSKLKNESAFQ